LLPDFLGVEVADGGDGDRVEDDDDEMLFLMFLFAGILTLAIV
jgi:hypothetical protein